MSHIEINEELLNFLIFNNIISKNEVKKNNEGKYIIKNPKIITLFENGVFFGKIAINFTRILNKEIDYQSFDELKLNSSLPTKKNNWNILINIFKQIEVEIDNDLIFSLINGNKNNILTLLNYLFNLYTDYQQKIKILKENEV